MLYSPPACALPFARPAELNNALKDGKGEDAEGEEESAFQATEEGPDPPSPYEVRPLKEERRAESMSNEERGTGLQCKPGAVYC